MQRYSQWSCRRGVRSLERASNVSRTLSLAAVAQSVEQGPLKPKVLGSIPSRCTMSKPAVKPVLCYAVGSRMGMKRKTPTEVGEVHGLTPGCSQSKRAIPSCSVTWPFRIPRSGPGRIVRIVQVHPFDRGGWWMRYTIVMVLVSGARVGLLGWKNHATAWCPRIERYSNRSSFFGPRSATVSHPTG